MSRAIVKSLFQSVNLHLVSTHRFGVEVEFDLARLIDSKRPRILDIGANVGQTALRFRRAFPECQVFSFEPVPHTFEMLRRATSGDPKIEALNYAMGQARGKAMIYTGNNSSTNTMLECGRDASGNAVEVQVETIDMFCEDRRIDSVDLLKIDVEGFELPVLRGAERMLRDGRVGFVYAECDFAKNPDTPHANFFDLHDRLSPLGYCLVSFYPEAFSLKHGSCHGNALFGARHSLPSCVDGAVRNIY
jgi:FkbM family methyltransferase